MKVEHIALVSILVIGLVAVSGCTGSGGTEGATDENGGEPEATDGTGDDVDTEEEPEPMAESISFSVDVDGVDYDDSEDDGTTTTSHYKARGIGTDETEIRVETEGQKTLILLEADEKGWVYLPEEDQWYEFAGMPGMSYDTYWTLRSNTLDSYLTYLEGWDSGEYTYEDNNGNTFTFYDVKVDPDLDDDLFDEPDDLDEVEMPTTQ